MHRSSLSEPSIALGKGDLTASQRDAYASLQFFVELQRRQIRSVGGIRTRPLPLVIGPSGCGKTFLIQKLAAAENLPIFAINAHNWIVRAARSEQPTLGQIAHFVRSNPAGIVVIDELNKLSREHIDDSSWASDVFSELIAFLDRDSRLEAMGFHDILERLKNSFCIVGAAAFQDEWQLSQIKGIGFVTGCADGPDFEDLVRRQTIVPDELIFRFNDRLVLISPPSADEFGSMITNIRTDLGLPVLPAATIDRLVVRATASSKMMRWLEGYAFECLSEDPTRLDRAAELFENSLSGDSGKSEQGSSPIFSPGSNGSPNASFVTAYGDYMDKLSELAKSACKLEFGVAQLWALSRSSNTESLHSDLAALLNSATARLRQISGHEKATLVGYLKWISTRATTVSATPTDERRAELANQIRDVSEWLEDAISVFKGNQILATVSPFHLDSFVGFTIEVRHSIAAFDRLRLLCP